MPYFEGKKSHVTICRKWIPITKIRYNSIKKNTLLLASSKIWFIYLVDDPHQSTYLTNFEIKTLDDIVEIHPCGGLSLLLDYRKPHCQKTTLQKRYYKIHSYKLYSLSHGLWTLLSITCHFSGLLPHNPQKGIVILIPRLQICSQIPESYSLGVGVLKAFFSTQPIFTNSFLYDLVNIYYDTPKGLLPPQKNIPFSLFPIKTKWHLIKCFHSSCGNIPRCWCQTILAIHNLKWVHPNWNMGIFIVSKFH